MAHIHTRFLEVVDQLNDGYGVRVGVESLDGKCAYSQELDRDETKALCKALVGESDADVFRKQRDDARARAEVERLESTNAELAAKVEAIGNQLAVAQGNYDHSSQERDAFRSQVKEVRALLAAEKRMREETRLGLAGERDDKAALQRRVNLMVSAECTSQDGWKAANEAVCRLTEERDEWKGRVKELEGRGEPVAWRVNSKAPLFYSDRAAAHDRGQFVACDVTPLYEAPQVALGVEGERFAALQGRAFLDLRAEEEAEHVASFTAVRMAARGTTCEIVRIVPAGTRTVDVAKVREAIEHLDNAHAYYAVGLLLAAIGET